MIVEVMLYGRVAGSVEWNNDRGNCTFQYNRDFINSLEPSPILMPTEGRTYETSRSHDNFHRLPYLLSDSLPDVFGHTMMREWLRLRNLSIEDINPVDRLTYVGKRGMGALEYIPAVHREGANGLLNISEIYEVANTVLESKQETRYPDLDKENITEILRIGTSAGGARAKALIAIKGVPGKKIEEVRSGDILQPKGYSYWLLKIDGANEHSLGEGEGLGKLEYAYFLLARQAGIEISESALVKENDRFHFMTKRFDRTDEGEKIHMQTFGALAGIDYKIPKASSYETLFRLMRRLQLPYNQIEQQYRRLVFNIVARNHDDHVKNFSFLMTPDGTWKISPAYDVCFSYSPGGNWTNEHQSSINGKFDHFTKDDLFGFAKYFGIKKPHSIVEEVVASVEQWPEIATNTGIPDERIAYIGKFLRTRDFL